MKPPTPAQLEVLEYVARGYTNREIAAVMFLSVATVKAQLCLLNNRIGSRSRTHAVMIALANGWIDLPGAP